MEVPILLFTFALVMLGQASAIKARNQVSEYPPLSKLAGCFLCTMNPKFNCAEFDIIKSQAGLNRFRLSAKEWTEKTNAIGIISKAGRYGGTYAHKDILR